MVDMLTKVFIKLYIFYNSDSDKASEYSFWLVQYLVISTKLYNLTMLNRFKLYREKREDEYIKFVN